MLINLHFNSHKIHTGMAEQPTITSRNSGGLKRGRPTRHFGFQKEFFMDGCVAQEDKYLGKSDSR